MGEHRGFLKEGVKTYQMAPMSPLNSPTFFVLIEIVDSKLIQIGAIFIVLWKY